MANLSYTASILCVRAAMTKIPLRSLSTVANPKPKADFLNGETHKKHPGVSHLNTLRLPEELQEAAKHIIKTACIPQLTELSQDLTNFMWSRKRLAEELVLRKKALTIEKKLWEKAMQNVGDIDDEALNKSIKSKVLNKLKRTTYHWTPLKFDKKLAVVYMAARLAGGYAAVMRALHEIKKRDPSFSPQFLLDFGSGLGTVAWASHSCWGDSLKEFTCVDSSGPMNILAERLLKGCDEHGKPHINQVYFRQFLPVSPKVQFDLVTAAFSLSELPNDKDREEVVMTLWRKTSSYLVLIENGTKEGHQILMAARNTLLTKQEKVLHDHRPASVFAPCPHEETCPKLTRQQVNPCNFLQRYHPLPLPGQNDCQTERFSYLILSRGKRAEAEPEPEGVDWTRLIGPVLCRRRHIHCYMCCSDGSLQHQVVTPRKHGRDVYRCARNSNWGDRLPLVKEVEEDVQQDSE